MASMQRPRLQAVQVLPGATLALTFIDGQKLKLDMSQALRLYPGLQPLRQPHAFAGAVLGDAGWTVDWPAFDIQIGADTLLIDALHQTAID
ncbi:DUF2442 domain-containing protein [Pseudomonas sp. HR96]|uniref:DUF2442 domain-containing protein n=1 Tax=Pseudomonas sp. HR96 TaxID=1027966 RepID=UPI002A74E4DE|nr:DUF2442 domain-containing protein [Pseudomonas sp. HR96]WPP00349.1 DUF2442 domain-containing protein [Pseudomonas sp. HR96]